MSKGLWVIYGLRLVDDPEYRYIGLTRVGAEQRLARHKSDSRRQTNRAVCTWVAKYLDSIVVDVIEECPEGDLEYLYEAEQFWIVQIRSFGHRLKNHSEGGASGSYGARWTLREDQIRRGSSHPLFGTKVSEAHIAKLADIRRGSKMSAESRAKMSASRSGDRHWAHGGGKFTEEHKQKISASLKGRPSDSAHKRYHLNRGISKPETCKYCKEEIE